MALRKSTVRRGSFSKPCHQATAVGQQVQGRECADHQPQVAAEAEDAT